MTPDPRAASTRNTTSLEAGTTVLVMPCCFRDETSAMPMPVPTMIPMMAPKMAGITASERIMVRTWWRFMATARSRPISRVRSKTESMRVFTIPISAMSTANGEQGVDQPEQLVDAGRLGLLELGPGLDLHVRIGG
jgi:hypothetical protein